LNQYSLDSSSFHATFTCQWDTICVLVARVSVHVCNGCVRK
jgi:hypothetical protein